MIADRTTGRTVESTLGGQTIQMGVKIENMPHIMGMLIDQYTDQEYASIREYATNAWDEHVKLGLNRPIEVSLPSRLSPFLRIKDFGVGMDVQTIEEVYSQYGSSTKRNSNDFNGMLGIGAKAALSYTDQFTVVSTKDGVTIQVSVSRLANGAGAMQIVTEAQTGKPSGTEIIIPAKLPNSFGEKAAHLFGYWKPGTVLIDGQPAKQHEHLALTDDIWLIDGDQSYVVMGNVPYKAVIQHDLPRGYDYSTRTYPDERSVAVFVPIGAVNFPPSREEVVSTDRATRETLLKARDRIAAAKGGAVQRKIDEEDTPAGAIQSMLKWTDALGLRAERDRYTWRTKTMPHHYAPLTKFMVTGSNGAQVETGMLLSDNTHRKLSKADRKDSLPVAQWEGTLLCYGYDRKGMTATQKRKLIQYVADNDLAGIKRFALTAERPVGEMAEWIGQARIIPWADVQAIKLPSTKAPSGYTGRLPGSYDLFLNGTWTMGVEGDKIDRSKPIFYVHGNYGAGNRHAELLAAHYTDCYVVCLSSNRIDKFCRILPAAKTADEAVAALWKVEASKYTPDERLALHIADGGARDTLALLDPARIDDPALREAIRLANIDIRAINTKRSKFARVVDTNTLDAVQWDNPLDNYPIYTAMFSGGWQTRSQRTSDDMYLYINTKFAQTGTTTKKGA